MTELIVQTPVSLLCDGELPASARLVWMAARLQPDQSPVSIAWLAEITGLTRLTVRAGLARLGALGWHPAPAASGPTVPVPAALLTNRKLSPQAKVLYGILHLTPGFHHPCGRFDYAGLASLAHSSRHTVGNALTELVQAEWIKLDRVHRLALIEFELTFPGRERGEVALAAAQTRLDRKDIPYGEALMREYLSLLIDSDAFEDNVSPGFLRNPRTQELLQFDRFYPPDVAWEFNGPQHYRKTRRFSAPQVAVQRERDYIKMGICMERQITLVVVLPENLTLAAMQQKVPDRLPRRDLTGFDLLIGFLEHESNTYRQRMKRI
ncbi:MAG TPA: hypothetical protein VNT75_00815 [Symbiobacteriaceae bacterium]|nr:hypothetical protein [Symbiobacteriaceae bacterium]